MTQNPIRVLLIDDDLAIRLEGIRLYFEGVVFPGKAVTITCLDRVPLVFGDYDVVTFDNDIIYEDVSEVLAARNRGRIAGESEEASWEDLMARRDAFASDFRGSFPGGRRIYVHSENPSSRSVFLGICQDCGVERVAFVPYSEMLRLGRLAAKG